jgi:small subunit ribosomal protein S18
MSKQQTKQCYFCAANIQIVDFKDGDLLRKFITPQAQIITKKRSGTCALHQRKLTRAIKHARFLALIPYVTR